MLAIRFTLLVITCVLNIASSGMCIDSHLSYNGCAAINSADVAEDEKPPIYNYLDEVKPQYEILPGWVADDPEIIELNHKWIKTLRRDLNYVRAHPLYWNVFYYCIIYYITLILYYICISPIYHNIGRLS